MEWPQIILTTYLTINTIGLLDELLCHFVFRRARIYREFMQMPPLERTLQFVLMVLLGFTLWAPIVLWTPDPRRRR